jgi:hypothetical protein
VADFPEDCVSRAGWASMSALELGSVKGNIQVSCEQE